MSTRVAICRGSVASLLLVLLCVVELLINRRGLRCGALGNTLRTGLQKAAHLLVAGEDF
jgi:hypothetical protein